MIKGGFAGRVRVHMCTEEHGGGAQFVRIRLEPFMARWVLVTISTLIGLGLWAAFDGAVFASAALSLMGSWILTRGIQECGGALAAGLQAVDDLDAIELVGVDRNRTTAGVEPRPAPLDAAYEGAVS
jgi:hypothetical protein